MTSSLLDSTAAFASRARELGLEEAVLKKLTAAKVDTFGALAFVSNYQIGQSDEGPLVKALSTALGKEPTQQELVPLRRLWFESSTSALSELKFRTERGDSSEPLRVPIAERVARLDEQKGRLVGVHITADVEPSYKLVDSVTQMGVEQQLVWTPCEKLASRSDEVGSTKPELSLSFDAAGALKMTRKLSDSSCSLSGDLRVRTALQRRSLAFDLARLCDYGVMEEYHDQLFQLMLRDPPPNCVCTSMSQVKEADRQLFCRIADSTRGALSLRDDGTKPFQIQLALWKDHPQIQFYLIPMPKPNRSAPYQPQPKKTTKGDPKGGGKEKEKGKGKGKKGAATDETKKAFDIPEGCATATKEGKPLCFTYNQAGCNFAKDGKRCRRGFHLCWLCFEPRSYAVCARRS